LAKASSRFSSGQSLKHYSVFDDCNNESRMRQTCYHNIISCILTFTHTFFYSF
jgi:hypothetical protein